MTQEINGLDYFLSPKTQTATVRRAKEENCRDLIVPTTIQHEDATYRVTAIGECAFQNYTDLTSITFPDGLVSIGGSAFKGCTGLKSIIIPDSVTSIGFSAFSGCTSLTSIIIPESVTSIEDEAFYGCESLTFVSVSKGLTDIGNSAFLDSGLMSIAIPNSVEYVGGWAFDGTPWYANQPDGLIYINDVLYSYKGGMPQNTVINVKQGTIAISGGAFERQQGLISITIPNSVTSIGRRAFSDCSSLRSIIIPDSVTVIEEGTFENCDSLASITIPDSVVDIEEDAFLNCDGLVSVTINSDVIMRHSSMKSIFGEQVEQYVLGYGVTRIVEWAFQDCIGLTSVTISNSVRSIADSAFEGCENFKTILIHRGMKDAFFLSDWWSDKIVEIDNIAEEKATLTIKDHTLLKCVTDKIYVYIPNGVERIVSNVFDECKKLHTIASREGLRCHIKECIENGMMHCVYNVWLAHSRGRDTVGLSLWLWEVSDADYTYALQQSILQSDYDDKAGNSIQWKSLSVDIKDLLNHTLDESIVSQLPIIHPTVSFIDTYPKKEDEVISLSEEIARLGFGILRITGIYSDTLINNFQFDYQCIYELHYISGYGYVSPQWLIVMDMTSSVQLTFPYPDAPRLSPYIDTDYDTMEVDEYMNMMYSQGKVVELS